MTTRVSNLVIWYIAFGSAIGGASRYALGLALSVVLAIAATFVGFAIAQSVLGMRDRA